MLSLAIENEKKILDALRTEKNVLQKEYDVLFEKVSSWTKLVSEKERVKHDLETEIANIHTRLSGMENTLKVSENETLIKRKTVSELIKMESQLRDSISNSETELALLRTNIEKESIKLDLVSKQVYENKELSVQYDLENIEKKKEMEIGERKLIDKENKAKNEVKELKNLREELERVKWDLDIRERRLTNEREAQKTTKNKK